MFSQSIDSHIRAIKAWQERLRLAADQQLHGRIAGVGAEVVSTSVAVTSIKENIVSVQEELRNTSSAIVRAGEEIITLKVDFVNGINKVLGEHMNNAECM